MNARAPRTETGESGAGRLWAYAGLLALFMFILVWGLRAEWMMHPASAHGWVVPLLGMWCFWKGWQERPRPQTVKAGLGFMVSTGLSAIYLFPVFLIQEANPGWRLLDWMLAGTIVGLILNLVWYAGGWPWIRHFFIPATFGLLAVPWPPELERGLVQLLVPGLTAMARVEGGNVPELGTGTAGLEAGGSGLIPLQVVLVATLALGELGRLSLRNKLLLVATGLLAALTLNSVLNSFLHGVGMPGGLIGPVAWQSLGGCLVLGMLVASAWLVRPRSERGQGPPGRAEQAADLKARAPKPFPLAAGLVLASWILLAQVMTLLWYWAHERHKSDYHLAWKVAWPAQNQGFQRQSLPVAARTTLRWDVGEAGVWHHSDGTEWSLLFLRWEPGGRATALANGQQTGVCLPPKGSVRIAHLGFTTIRVHMLEMPFQVSVFQKDGRRLYSFSCQMEEDALLSLHETAAPDADYLVELDRKRRLHAVLEGRRHRGQQLFEATLAGYASQLEARRALEVELSNLIQISG